MNPSHIILAFLFGSPAFGGQAAARDAIAVPPSRSKVSFAGFDRNLYPGDDRLAELRRHFAFTGYWLNTPPGAQANTWTGHRKALRAAGFGFLLLFNGRAAAGLKAAAPSPEELGAQDALAAAAAARREGFPAHAILFLDQEEGGRLTPAQAAYFFAWTEAVAAAGFRPGAYLSGQPAPDGTASDGSALTITTAAAVRQQIAAAHGKLHDVALWVYNDTCPPAPGCTLALPKLSASGTPEALAWQYAQSPRRPADTQACAQTYAPDNLCYADATKDIFVDLNMASSNDPSGGR